MRDVFAFHNIMKLFFELLSNFQQGIFGAFQAFDIPALLMKVFVDEHRYIIHNFSIFVLQLFLVHIQ